jgi:hypothetical protein
VLVGRRVAHAFDVDCANDLIDAHAYVTLALLAAVTLGAVASLFSRSSALAFLVVALSAVLLLVLAFRAFTAERDAGMIYPPALGRARARHVRGSATPPAERHGDRVGELVGGKRHGEWFIYHPNGVLAETRRYDQGAIVETYVPK